MSDRPASLHPSSPLALCYMLMLPPEPFGAADMSGQSTLERSSWKADAIRKGSLKISGPIPITEHMPLNAEEEKEFAETGALQSHHELDPLHSTPQTPPQPMHLPPKVPVDRASLISHPVEDQIQQDVMIQLRQPSPSPPRPRQIPETARESAVEPTSYSPNGFQSTPENASKMAAQKKKRKSGLRNVFRKMFGRKSKHEPEEGETLRRAQSYHDNHPGMLQQSPPQETQTPSGPRISDLPIKELQPLHPLGQQLPFPMNVNAPQASPPNQYLTCGMQRPGIGRRRTTLPSVPSAAIQRHSLDEPRPRLSAGDERPDEDTLPSPGIGIALSSPTQATPTRSKRRSQSADALRELVKDRASTDRRRSAEIRYWRQSHASASIYSRPHTAQTVETIRTVQIQGPAVTGPDDGIVEMSATLAHVDEPSPLPQDHDEDRHAQPPVSAFNFELKSGLSDGDTMSPEAPVPVSLPERNRNRLSIEDRVAHLEGNFQSIESSLRRMSSRSNQKTIILADAPRNLRSRNRSSSTSHANSDKLLDYQSSNDTLKSNPASPTLVKQSAEGGKENVMENLYEALKYERSARKSLEQQVQGLQHDIADLHALVNKLIASATTNSPSYPTPSPDTLIPSTEERLVTPRADGKGHLSYGKENQLRRTNSYDRDDRDQQDWRDHPTSPNDGDVWATPKEEGFGVSGFFHHEARGYA